MERFDHCRAMGVAMPPVVMRSFLATGVAVLVQVGCATDSGRSRWLVGTGDGSSMIFNPESTGLLPEDFDRSDWPVAVVSAHQTEEITYREVIHDRQGRFRSDGDYLNRRFESVRTGWTRR
jgi:hypothetical protein